MSKYKPEKGDSINFKHDGKTCSGVIRWIASSGFVLVMDHDITIKSATGTIECDVFVESGDIIGKKII
jgi:hypothetical protein